MDDIANLAQSKRSGFCHPSGGMLGGSSFRRSGEPNLLIRRPGGIHCPGDIRRIRPFGHAVAARRLRSMGDLPPINPMPGGCHP